VRKLQLGDEGPHAMVIRVDDVELPSRHLWVKLQ
jgi:hypothetical protein